MRRLMRAVPETARGALAAAALIAAAAIAACASAGAPPGGPERHEPPVLLKVTPDSGATNVKIGEANFQFDEVVAEKPSKGELDQVFLISPRDGTPRIGWHRTRISIRPRHGFQPNTAYKITMLPGVNDLRGNVLKEGKEIVFATGPAIPRQGIVGRAFDWLAETPAKSAIVEAVRLPDSLVFITSTDSVGEFDIGPFGPGTYLLRGYLDQNANFAIDRTEKWDSMTVAVGDNRPQRELLLIVHDSTPPLLTQVTMDDSLTVALGFDKALRPGAPGTFGTFRVVRSDSTPLTIAGVYTRAQYSARRDSLRADSTRAQRRADTTKAPPVTPPAAPAAPADTSRGAAHRPAPPPKPGVPAPPVALVLMLSPQTPLQPGKSYRITAADVPGLNGRMGRGNRILSIPRPDTTKAKGDSTHAGADTTKRPARPPIRPPGR